MNWLAHLYLSKPDPAFRIGNLLPDLLPMSALATVADKFSRGIQCHQAIDSYTDAHPVVRRSIARIQPPYRRYGGVLVDIFYDHFLATNWNHYSNISLDDFATDVYAGFEQYAPELPPNVREVFWRMQHGRWIHSYQDTDGVARALGRIGARLKKPFPLEAAIEPLHTYYADLQSDFTEFFPELKNHISTMFDIRP